MNSALFLVWPLGRLPWVGQGVIHFKGSTNIGSGKGTKFLFVEDFLAEQDIRDFLEFLSIVVTNAIGEIMGFIEELIHLLKKSVLI
jgi:hypothetical protein